VLVDNLAEHGTEATAFPTCKGYTHFQRQYTKLLPTPVLMLTHSERKTEWRRRGYFTPNSSMSSLVRRMYGMPPFFCLTSTLSPAYAAIDGIMAWATARATWPWINTSLLLSFPPAAHAFLPYDEEAHPPLLDAGVYVEVVFV